MKFNLDKYLHSKSYRFVRNLHVQLFLLLLEIMWIELRVFNVIENRTYVIVIVPMILVLWYFTFRIIKIAREDLKRT